jgi:hypothetical protein
MPIGFKSTFVFVLCSVCAAASGPIYTADGSLKFPDNYREWVFLSSGSGMTYGPLAEREHSGPPLFDNVFVNPESYRSFLQSGNTQFAKSRFH